MTGPLSLAAADVPVVLADHPLITAVPFFVPAFAVAAVVGAVIWRDRRRQREPSDDEP